MIVQSAPAIIGMLPKSCRGPSAEDRAVRMACIAARGVECTLPILFDNRVLGYVRGIRNSADVMLSIGGYDQVINSIANGQRYTSIFNRISNQSQALSTWWDYYPLGPNGGTYTGAANTARQLTDATVPSLPHGGNVSPATKFIASAMAFSHNGGVVVMLYDRVLTYEACTPSGSLQNMTNGSAAQRYISAGQPGLQIMCTVQTALGSGVNLTALVYTNQAGTGGHTIATGTNLTINAGAATPTTLIPAEMALQYAASATGDVLFLPLAAGDSGVQLITSHTWSGASTGSVCFALVHPIAYLTTPGAALAAQYDLMRQYSCLERIYDGACLSFAVLSNLANDHTITGSLDFVWS